MNRHILALVISLGANADRRAVLTAGGEADYVCKRVAKSRAGAPASAELASLMDNVVTRAPEGGNNNFGFFGCQGIRRNGRA